MIKNIISLILIYSITSCASVGVVYVDSSLPTRIVPKDSEEEYDKELTIEETRYCMYESKKYEYYKKTMKKSICSKELEELQKYKKICNTRHSNFDNKNIIYQEIKFNEAKILDEAKPLIKSCSKREKQENIANISITTLTGAALILKPIETLTVIGIIYAAGLLAWGLIGD